MNVNFSSVNTCFRCGGSDIVLDYKAGDVICRDCGEVINGRVIDEGNEIKFYADDNDRHKYSRTSGLSESIGSLQTTFITNSDTVKRTLERAQKFSSDKKELQALSHLSTVAEMCSKMNLILPIKNKAIEVFTKTIMGRLLISKSKDPIIAACVYLACRMENYPRTLDEVSLATGVDVKQVSKMQQVIARKLQLSIGRLRPQHLVNRFATRVNCPHSATSLAVEICQNITRLELFETLPPQLVAAGSLVAAALIEGVSIDMELLTSVTLVSLLAIKSVYRQLLPVLPMVTVTTLDPATAPAAHHTPTTQSVECGNKFRTARVKTLPLILDKCIQDGKLVVIERKLSVPPAPVAVVRTPEKQRAAEDNSLADLVNEIAAPVAVAVPVSALTPSVSLQNLASELASAYVSCCASQASALVARQAGTPVCSDHASGGVHKPSDIDGCSRESSPGSKEGLKRERTATVTVSTVATSSTEDIMRECLEQGNRKIRRVEEG